ncbi:alpha/beta hydrolase [Tamlana crocina]
MANVKPRINHPTLMIYGEKDVIPKSQTLNDFAPDLNVVSLNCGHHIQQEKPKETNETIITWLKLRKIG